MKILQKIKKVFASIGAFFIGVTSKVFASYLDLGASQLLYGVVRPEPEPEPLKELSMSIWNIFKFFIIPIALIIGLIIYFKKSKSSTKKKVIIMISAILIVIAICLEINYFVVNLF